MKRGRRGQAGGSETLGEAGGSTIEGSGEFAVGRGRRASSHEAGGAGGPVRTRRAGRGEVTCPQSHGKAERPGLLPRPRTPPVRFGGTFRSHGGKAIIIIMVVITKTEGPC